MSQMPDEATDPPVDGPREESAVGPEVPSSEQKKSRSEREGPPRPGVIEAVADLLQFIVDWLRQEATAIVHDKIVLPLQKLGLTLASGCAAASLAALGLAFISAGVFILLGTWITYPGALLLTGGVLVLGAIVFTIIKMRSIQK
jgi:hypothetical protein